MNEVEEVTNILVKKLNFTINNVEKIKIFQNALLSINKKYNLIGKSTENNIWKRHILDSAQLVKFIKYNDNQSLSDLGSGGGFPGIILAIFNTNPLFHVKLYEKSPVKADFLLKMIELLDIKAYVKSGSYNNHILDSDYIVCRAFKKIGEIMRISREKAQKSHLNRPKSQLPTKSLVWVNHFVKDTSHHVVHVPSAINSFVVHAKL